MKKTTTLAITLLFVVGMIFVGETAGISHASGADMLVASTTPEDVTTDELGPGAW